MLPSSTGMAKTPIECVLPHCIWSFPFLHPKHWQNLSCFCLVCQGKSMGWMSRENQSSLQPRLNGCFLFKRKCRAAELWFSLCDSPPQLGTLRQFARACNRTEQNKGYYRGQVLSCQQLSDMQRNTWQYNSALTIATRWCVLYFRLVFVTYKHCFDFDESLLFPTAYSLRGFM